MGKYIIELGEDAKAIQSISITPLGNVYIDSWYVENLEELNSDYINEHFGELQDTAYQKGFEDGKAVHEKGCEGCEYEEVVGLRCRCCANRYPNQWTAKQTDDEIKVGDEVRLCRHKVPYIVTSCDGDDDTYILMTVNGGFIKAEKYNVRKTGRRFDIKSILESMKA